jgi:hypothetical protein
VGTPISWLRLEQLALGELSGDEAGKIREHLRVCAACQACADECLEPVEMPPLPARATSGVTRASSPEESPQHAGPAKVLSLQARRERKLRWVAPSLVGVALAAAATLVFVGTRAEHPHGGQGMATLEPTPDFLEPAAQPEVTPDLGVTLTLLRERNGTVATDPESFALGDRFAVQITCRPGDERMRRVAVHQDGVWTITADSDARCGNHVRIPGAFRLTKATPAEICVLWGDAATRPASELDAPARLRDARCQRVEPQSEPDLPR